MPEQMLGDPGVRAASNMLGKRISHPMRGDVPRDAGPRGHVHHERAQRLARRWPSLQVFALPVESGITPALSRQDVLVRRDG